MPYLLLVMFEKEQFDSTENTAKNVEISPHFLLGKFLGNGHISHNFPKGK